MVKSLTVSHRVHRAHQGKVSLVLFFLFFLINSNISAETLEIDKKTKTECVILLHGLARTSSSMNMMEQVLSDTGYGVFNIDYPSRKHTVETLSKNVIPPALDKCQNIKADKIHFVTHSMGGILVRHYLSSHKIENLGRVVMLSPPNQGSEVVDKLKNVPGYTLLNGPAGHQLGTDKGGIPSQLGPANFDVGIITGNQTINFFLSTIIPGDDDGKVSVERTKLEGMNDFLVMPYSHPFIMKREKVIQQVITFLQKGNFIKDI